MSKSNRNPHNIEVGQQLWLWCNLNRPYGEFVTVTKVGRKWAEIDCTDRIDLESLELDGADYSPRGRCWISKQAWADETRFKQLWRDLVIQMHNLRAAPPDLTIEKIQSIYVTLGLSVPEPIKETR